MLKLSRRGPLKGVAGATTASPLGASPEFIRSAYAATSLTAIERGGDVVDAMKRIEAKQSAVQINRVLHQTGSGAIPPKIKAG